MFRFSIRELMLVTLVVALGVGWSIDKLRNANHSKKLESSVKELEREMKMQELFHESTMKHFNSELAKRPLPPPPGFGGPFGFREPSSYNGEEPLVDKSP